MATSVPPVPAKKKSLGKSRAVCWTLNNYTEQEVINARGLAQSSRYLVWGYEVGEECGTPHLQGFICWETPRSLDKFKADLSPRVHLATMRGTHEEASNYCKKGEQPKEEWHRLKHLGPTFGKNAKVEEFGELPVQGARTDWALAVEQLQTTPVVDVVINQPQLLPGIKALERFKQLTMRPKHRDVEVTVLWGQAGTGKSLYAWQNFPDLYSKPLGDWWDGYSGETTVLLDDYYGYLPYSELLRALDRYPLKVPIKGGFVDAQWERVIITSNKPPEQWYKDLGLTAALLRRINKIFYLSIDEDGSPKTEQTYPPPSQGTSRQEGKIAQYFRQESECRIIPESGK